MADTPEHASDYLRPLLSFAAAHVPVKKHKETPLYILCTAGMRLLPERWDMQALRNRKMGGTRVARMSLCIVLCGSLIWRWDVGIPHRVTGGANRLLVQNRAEPPLHPIILHLFTASCHLLLWDLYVSEMAIMILSFWLRVGSSGYLDKLDHEEARGST